MCLQCYFLSLRHREFSFFGFSGVHSTLKIWFYTIVTAELVIRSYLLIYPVGHAFTTVTSLLTEDLAVSSTGCTMSSIMLALH